MQISYQNTKLEKTLSSDVLLLRKYGEQVASRITQRLQELDAADSLADLPPHIRPHPHEPKHEEIFSIDIFKHQHPTRLLFRPIDTYDIADYETVTSIQVIEIIKIHS